MDGDHRPFAGDLKLLDRTHARVRAREAAGAVPEERPLRAERRGRLVPGEAVLHRVLVAEQDGPAEDDEARRA